MDQSAFTLVFDPEGYVLALRRGPTDPWRPGHWNFPGGRVDPSDETVVDAAARELAEEAGICLPPEALNHAFSFRDRTLTHIFWVELPRRSSVFSSDNEHDAYTWARLDQIPDPVIPNLPYVISRITGQAV